MSNKCIHCGMYDDCNLYRQLITASYDATGVCKCAAYPYPENYCNSYKETNYMTDIELKPVGSTEGVWRYAHPSDVGLFTDGKGHGWFIRHKDYLEWKPEKLLKWLADKPCNIYHPQKMGIYKRPGVTK